MRPKTDHRLAEVVRRSYGLDVVGIVRILQGMGTTNWKVSTAQGDFFLKQYPSTEVVVAETAAIELALRARDAGVPTPAVRRSRAGEWVHTEGDLAFSLVEFVADTTSGLALTLEQMVAAGRVLGNIHDCLRSVASTFPALTAEWTDFDLSAKRRDFSRYLDVIENRSDLDEFDRRSRRMLERRIELLPKVAELMPTIPPLAEQVVHGDYSVCNLLFRGPELVAVVDFRPPEPFLPAFEIGRAALSPEAVTEGAWREKAFSFVEAYCRANPSIPRVEIEFAPHVWAIQLLRSEYGVRQHYFRPLEQQAELDRFWFQRCETAEAILEDLTEISREFASAWARR